MSKIKIYDAYLNPENLEDGLSCISIVDCPAMETPMLVFEQDKKPILFAVNDEMKHEITSVVIRAGFPVYRYSNGKEWYIRFGKDVIRQLNEKYSKDGLLNQVSVQHNGELLDDITMIEHYIKDVERGINPKCFEEVEDGSLFCTFKINNDDVWQQIVDGNFGGLSMEVIVDVEPTEEYIENDEELEMNSWLAELLAWLEDEDDVEIVMSKDEKWLVNGDGEYWLDENDNKVPAKCPKCGSPVGVYIKGEPVFLCSECGEYLGTVKFPDDLDFSDIKKNFKRVTSGDIQDAMNKNRKVNIVIGKQTLYEQQITSIGTDSNGNRIAVVYDPQHNDWETYKIHDITSIEVTEVECENLAYNKKWESITNDPMLEIDVTLPSLGVGKDTFDWCMDRNAYCMIEYNDETEDPATGFRTCIITSWGYTQKSKGNGNECLRVWEASGDTKTGFDNGRYRFILTRRIKSFRAVDYAEPSLQAPPLYNAEAQQGTGKRGTMSRVKRTAVFPAVKRLNE